MPTDRCTHQQILHATALALSQGTCRAWLPMCDPGLCSKTCWTPWEGAFSTQGGDHEPCTQPKGVLQKTPVCGQVRARQLWGNEVYTQDSDLVAVLMHCGFYNHALAAPPANIAEVDSYLHVLTQCPGVGTISFCAPTSCPAPHMADNLASGWRKVSCCFL